MRKIKLHSIGNRNDYNYYVFDKKNNVITILSEIFGKTLNVDWDLYNENHDTGTRRKINFENSKECHSNITGGRTCRDKNTRVDVFYGTKKINVVVHCSLPLRKKLNEELEKISYMKKIINKPIRKKK
jgi:hypothetical protein